MTGDPQSARMCRCHIIKTRLLALSLVKEPGCVYDDLTSTCQTLDGIQTGLRPQASCKHTTTVLLSLSPGPRNKPPTRAWTMVMLMAHTFSSSSHNTIMCCGNGCASGPDNNKAAPRPPPLHHLSALFTPGLHYEVQRKSSRAIWKNLQDRDADRVIPHPHKENLRRGRTSQRWNRCIVSDKMLSPKCFEAPQEKKKKNASMVSRIFIDADYMST